MKLSATLTTAELRQLADLLIPLRVDLGGDEQPGDPDYEPRWLDVVELLDSTMHAEQGFSLAARAAIRWPERPLVSEFRVERVEIMLTPRIEPSAEQGMDLVVALRCRELDVNWVPDFVSAAIVGRINKRLEQAGAEFRWAFTDSLSFSFTETAAHSNIERICLDVSTAQLEIRGGSVHIEGPMTIDIRRREPASIPALPAKPEGS